MHDDRLKTRDPEILSQTICEIMEDKGLRHPLDAHTLLDAVKRLHSSALLHFDKIYDGWIFTNLDKDDWVNHKRDIFNGSTFAVFDLTPEIAMARGIHYYYHMRIKE